MCEISSILSLPTSLSPPAPSPVQGITLTPYPSSICVSWSPPADDGGQPVSGYVVQWAPVTTPVEGSATLPTSSSSPVVGVFTNMTTTETTSILKGLSSSTLYM